MADDGITKSWLEDALQTQVLSFDVSSAIEKGDDSFACVANRINVEMMRNGCRESRSLVVKMKKPNEQHHAMMLDLGIYEREFYFYKTVLPRLNEYIARKCNGNPFPLPFPKFVNGSDDPVKSYVLLEDLKPEGFRMSASKSDLDEAHCRLVLMALADYHAASLAMKETGQTDLMEDCRNRFEIQNKNWVKSSEPMFDNIFQPAFVFINGIPELEKFMDVTKRFRKDCDKLNDDLLMHASDWTALCHGDCWSGNVLFRYEKRSDGTDEVVAARLLDMQCIYCMTVGVDIWRFLQCGASLEVLQSRLPDLLVLYHSKLLQRLRDLGLTTIQLKKYNLQAFLEEMSYLKPFAYLIGLMILVSLIPVSQEHMAIDLDPDSMEDFFKQRIEKVASLGQNSPFGKRALWLLEQIRAIYN